MSIDVETVIDQSDLESFIVTVIEGSDVLTEDGVLPVVDGLLADFRINSTCTTARRFEQAVRDIVDSRPPNTVTRPTNAEIQQLVRSEMHKLLGGLTREWSTLERTMEAQA